MVEMLVVIAIIGILIALLLPAVQAAREAARRNSCLTKVKQICTAAQNYMSVHKTFPVNYGDPSSGATGEHTRGVSWLTLILPELEQEPLYKMIERDEELGFIDDARGKNNRYAAARQLEIYTCPSDSHDGMAQNEGLMSGLTNYKACGGANYIGTPSGYIEPYRKADAPSPPAPNGGYGGRNAQFYFGIDHGDGVICRNALHNPTTHHAGEPQCPGLSGPLTTSDMEIRDGLSNTFLLGESVPAWCNWSAWMWWDGSTATCGIPLNHEEPNIRRKFNRGDKQSTYGFMSRHSDGGNFGFCDGSARYINEDIDMHTYHGLATIDGGELLEKF